jgi:hypothetical protein
MTGAKEALLASLPCVDLRQQCSHKHKTTAANFSLMVALWGKMRRVFLCLVRFAFYFVAQAQGSFAASSAEIAYVVEPFESISDRVFTTTYSDKGSINLSTIADAAFGTNAFRVDYEAVQTETWGGFVDFGTIASRAHSCIGATHMSLWYKVVKPQTSTLRCHLRVILLDDSDCALPMKCSDQQQLEHYYSFEYVLDDSRSEWRELRIELRGDTSSESPFWQTGWSGTAGNRMLDPGSIRGWKLEINIDSQGELGSSSSGSLVLDQLACIGSGELIGAAFRLKDQSFSDAVETGVWADNESETRVRRNQTNCEIKGGGLALNYTVHPSTSPEQALGFMHIAPDPGYYNLSQAERLSLSYAFGQAPSTGGELELQMTLLDMSDCELDCDEYPGLNLEHYRSFPCALDKASLTTGDATIALESSDSLENSLVLTHATEHSQHDMLDLSSIKGFSLTVTFDSFNNATVSGQIVLSNLLARTRDVSKAELAKDTGVDSTCIQEPDFRFNVNQVGVRRMEFVSRKCCQVCDASKDCLYALTDGIHCYMAPSLSSASVGVTGLTVSPANIRAFWMDDKYKRGDFCSLCECRKMDKTIDCRGRSLLILPKTFTPTEAAWEPEVLDIRYNPNLVLLGDSTLVSLSKSLRELRLPLSMRHLSYESVYSLPFLETVTWEVLGNETAVEQESINHHVANIITESSGFFGNVCCRPGTHIDLRVPSQGLTFCNMTPGTPGADSVYQPFVEYYDAQVLAVLQPSSGFMSEASESAEKCAEYCSIRDGCKYFSYDSRIKNTESSCFHLATTGTPSRVCCKAEDYADVDRTVPGWISGRVPVTRHELDNARVVIASSKDLVISKENNYTTEIVFALGSSPLRGAVWIRPILAAETEFAVSFVPDRVALYDDLSTFPVAVRLAIPDKDLVSNTFYVTFEVEACDSAFVSSGRLAAETMAKIDVVVEPPSSLRLPAVIVPLIAVLLVAAVYLYVDHKKRRAESVWIIQRSELVFRNPPEVLGIGTFGLVLLAEYRGTQVAVKRVLPPRNVPKESSSKTYPGPKQEAPLQWNNLSQGPSLGRSAKRQHARMKADFIDEMRLLSKLRHPCITTVMGKFSLLSCVIGLMSLKVVISYL